MRFLRFWGLSSDSRKKHGHFHGHHCGHHQQAGQHEWLRHEKDAFSQNVQDGQSCPLCKNHCSPRAPKCDRGKEYAAGKTVQ